MTTDPRIEAAAKAVCESRHRHHKTKRDYWTDAGDYAQGQYRDDARAALAAADNAATITTVVGLGALPDGTVLRDHWGNVAELAVYDLGSEKPVRTWHRTDGTEDENVPLPATIIHWGTA